MKPVAPLLALLLSFAIPLAAIAQPRVIANLSEGALLGQIRNTAQLQRDFSSQSTLLAEANARLGLSQSDFQHVREAVAHGRARYVEIPRHLDGMAGQYQGHAFAVHDVVIPAHIYGWEVDIDQPDALVRVFMPNRCGNLSYLRVPRRSIVAAAPIPTPAPAVIAPFPAPAPAFVSPPAPAVTPAPVAIAPVVSVAPVVHHLAFLPWLALGLLSVALLHHTPGGSTPIIAPVTVATPAPIHTVCPPAAIAIRPPSR